MKRIVILLLTAVLLFVLAWGGSLLYCEILTGIYRADFAQVQIKDPMIAPMESIKVLSCDGQTARLYCVSEGKSLGSILTFQMADGVWYNTNWETVWSSSGSASDVVWPYWHHCAYGGL